MRHNQQGFTLIEVVISLAIISIALVTLLTVFNRTLLTADESGTITTAAIIANERLAMAGLDTVPQPGETGWQEDPRYPGYDYRQVVTNTALERARLVQVQVRRSGREILEFEKYLVAP